MIYTFVPARPVRTLVKTLSVSALAATSYLSGGPHFLTLALSASAFGDFFLAAPGEKRFLAGVASFAIAHMAYVALFLQFGADLSMVSTGRVLLILALIALSAFLLFRILWKHLGSMKLPLTFYFLVIMAMTIFSLLLPAKDGSLVIAVGAVSFAFSDMILGYEIFVPEPKSTGRIWTSTAVWILYMGAQYLITFGALTFVLH